MSSKTEQRERLAGLLIAHCKANNLSGTHLARLLEVSQPSAQAYLDGRTYPSEEVRKRIAKLLGLTFDELQSKIDGLSPDRKLTADELARELRLATEREFWAILAPVMFERMLSDHQSRIK